MTRITYHYNGKVTGQQSWPEQGTHYDDPDMPARVRVSIAFLLFLAAMFGILFLYIAYPAMMGRILAAGGWVVLVLFVFVFMPLVCLHLYRERKKWLAVPGFREWEQANRPGPDERRRQLRGILAIIVFAVLAWMVAR